MHALLIFCIVALSLVLAAVKLLMSGKVSEEIAQGVREHVHTYYSMNESDVRLKDTELRPEETTG